MPVYRAGIYLRLASVETQYKFKLYHFSILLFASRDVSNVQEHAMFIFNSARISGL